VEVNRGSSSGYAAGFRWAFENGYDYVLLLNNDIEVEPDLLDRLVEVAESDPAIGCVGPKCYFHGDRQRLWSAGGILRFRESITRERGYGEIDRTGRYYYHCDNDSSDAHIAQYDISTDAPVRRATSPVHAYGSRHLLISGDGPGST